MQEAHRLGIRVQVHATQLADVHAALAAGADSLVHPTYTEVVDDATWRRMAAGKVAWTPSLGAMMAGCEPAKYAKLLVAEPAFVLTMPGKRQIEMKNLALASGGAVFPWKALAGKLNECRRIASQNMRRALELGVPLAVGSDSLPAGANQHLEMLFLQEAGLTPGEVLSAATRGGAVSMGAEGGAGDLRAGGKADFVVLRANPLEDVRNARRIEWIVKGGRCYTQEELLSVFK